MTRPRTDPSRNRVGPSRDREEAVSFCRLPDPGRLMFLAVDTGTPYTLEFDGADGDGHVRKRLPPQNLDRLA